MKIKKEYFWPLLIILIFITLRFYKLPTTLEFFGDVGRDLHELTLMIEEKKPTLLGPGISFLPLNQSPIYYYSLLPVFLLTNRSALTAQITFALLYVSFFVFGYWFLSFKKGRFKKNKQSLILPLLIVGAHVSLHPEFVHQLRNPWNPSFAPPFIFVSLFSLFYIKEKSTVTRLLVLSFGLALGLAMTVSLTPAALVILAYACYLVGKKGSFKKVFQLPIIFLGSLMAVFSPVILFEIKHNFFFIKRLMLDDPYLSKETVSLGQKSIDLLRFLTGTATAPSLFWTLLATAAILLALVINLYLIKKEKIRTNQDNFFIIFLSLSLASVFLTLLAPFVLHAHYIFGILTLVFMTLSLMRKKVALITLIFLGLIWLHPAQSDRYFTPPRRTIDQMLACMQLSCDQLDGPTFVTAQAWHEYHSALEYTYLLNRTGCQARNIIQHPNFARQMIVVADNSDYKHNETRFSEITLLGPSLVTNKIKCDEDLSVYFLKPTP